LGKPLANGKNKWQRESNDSNYFAKLEVVEDLGVVWDDWRGNGCRGGLLIHGSLREFFEQESENWGASGQQTDCFGFD